MPKKIHSKKYILQSNKIQGLVLITIGVILISIYVFWKGYNAKILSFTYSYPQEIVSEIVNEKQPTYIHIPSLNIDLNVTEGKIVDGVWEISNIGASHLNQSNNPGDGGNVVIYGHNKKSILGPILSIKKGSEIKLETREGTTYKYEVTNTVIVKPNEIEYVLPKNREVLTLYTCTGFADSRRFIVVANLNP